MKFAKRALRGINKTPFDYIFPGENTSMKDKPKKSGDLGLGI